MLKKSLIFLIGLFFINGVCYGASLLETESFILSMESYLRKDVVTFKNVVDLDSSNSDDTTTYLGIDYNLGFKSEFKNGGPKFYLKLERNGPSDYDAPLFVHNTLMTTGGVIEEYRNDELLPNLEEFWLDVPLGKNFRFKSGLYTYEVGNGFSLNGAYENFGFSLYQEFPDLIWRLYYCRPDVVYKNHLGPRIRQDQEQDYVYNHNASNFFATDVKFSIGKNTLWPYVGVLADYTSPQKRDNSFTAAIKRDLLGTLGMAWDLRQGNLSLAIEAAHNFGKAESENPEYKDVYHAGYLIYTDIDYHLGKFIPSLGFLFCSGNKVTPEMASNSTLTSGKNRAFSYFSPLNKNLTDSIGGYHAQIRPIVAMASGYGLNNGVPRPKTFYVSDFDNIIIISLGFNFDLTKKLSLGLDGYYLRSQERGVGTLEGKAKYLPAELGYELDLSIDYQLKRNILFEITGGYFLPGKYYKEKRDDTGGSLFSSFVRGDGNVDSAYQIELSMEFKF